jgi:predicted nucleic acid-binding protein
VRSIAKGQLIALDTVVFIYAFERHQKFGPAATRCLKRIEDGELTGVASTVLFAELLPREFSAGASGNAQAVRRQIDNFPNLSVRPVTGDIAVTAARLRATYRLRTPDAMHAATALQAGAAGFVTNDHRLSRLTAEGLKLWTFDGAP